MRYELTERGKIIIAIVLVLLLFVLPSAYFAVKAWLGSPAPPQENPPQAMEPAPGTTEDEPVTSDGPLPNGSGFYPPENPPQNGNGESAYPGEEDDPTDAPEFGFVSVNTVGGTLIFLYAPELQNALDTETESKIELFLSSPRNTPDSQIAVTMPQLSGGDLDILISAISHTFASYEVLQERLAYITYNVEPDIRSFEVRFSYLQAPDPK